MYSLIFFSVIHNRNYRGTGPSGPLKSSCILNISRHTKIKREIILLLLSILWTPVSHVSAQDSLDSLLAKTESPEAKMQLLDELSWDYRKEFPNGALDLAQKGLTLAREQQDLVFQEKFYSRIASAWFHLQKLDSAIFFLEKSLKIAQKRENEASLGGIYYNLSQYQNYQGNYPQALRSIYEAIGFYKKLDNPRYRSMAHQRLGEIQASAEHIPEAIAAFEKALRISQDMKDTALMIQQIQSIGTLKVALAQKKGKDLEEGIALLMKAREFSKQKAAYEAYLPSIESNLGLAHSRMGDCQRAIAHFKKGIQELQQMRRGQSATQASIIENYGHCLVETGDIENAKYWANIALNMARKAQNPRATLGVYKFMSEAYEADKDHQTALEYERKAYILAEQLRNDAREREIAFIRKDYEIRQRELELREARALQRKSEYGAYALLAGIIALGLGSFVLIQSLRKNQKKREAALISQAEKEKLGLLEQLQKRELQSYAAAIEGQEMERRRIAAELHDGVGGTMAALKMTFSSLSRKISPETPQYESYEKAMNLLNNAVQEVRQLSHQMAAKQLLHEDLKLAIHELVAVLGQKENFGIQVDLDVLEETELSPEQKLNIYRLIQEHFQNTLKHAQANSVELKILRRHQWLFIEFRDNGKGFDYKEGEVLPGLGLQNIEKRIKQLGGRWSLQTSRGKGLRSIIEIPLHREFKAI